MKLFSLTLSGEVSRSDGGVAYICYANEDNPPVTCGDSPLYTSGLDKFAQNLNLVRGGGYQPPAKISSKSDGQPMVAPTIEYKICSK